MKRISSSVRRTVSVIALVVVASTSVAVAGTPSAPSGTLWPSSPVAGLHTSSATARSFARNFLHFAVANVLSVRSTSGGQIVVSLFDGARGAPTVVTLRERSSDATWWVTSARTASIVIGAPTSNAVVTSPLHLSGSSVAYEGVVNVSLRVSGRATPLVTSTVMGGGSQLSPFKGTIRFAGTHGQRGVLVLTELSAKDGSVICATVVPVRFG